MKRTLKESVRDIRKMIGRIDHATIVEAPGDEEGTGDEKVRNKTADGEIGGDEIEKGIKVPKVVPVPPANTYKMEKLVFGQLQDYASKDPTLMELTKTLNSKGIKSTNDFKAGELFSLMSELGGGESPFSMESSLGKDYKLKFKTKLGKNITFKTDLKLKQKEKGVANIADGFKFGGVNASLTFTVPNLDKSKKQLGKGKKV